MNTDNETTQPPHGGTEPSIHTDQMFTDDEESSSEDGEPSMSPTEDGVPLVDTLDWRSQLLPISRERIINKIMETLKRHLPFSGPEGLQELNQIAVRFEEKVCTAATSQSDYLRKISMKLLKMETKSSTTMRSSFQSNSSGSFWTEMVPIFLDQSLEGRYANEDDWQEEVYLLMQTMETKFQNTMANSLQFNSAGNSNRPPDPDSTAQTGCATWGDWQEEVYQKIKVMKDMHLPKLSELSRKIAGKLQEHDSVPQPKSENLEMLKVFQTILFASTILFHNQNQRILRC